MPENFTDSNLKQTSSLKSFLKFGGTAELLCFFQSVHDEIGSVDKSFDAVGEASFCSAIESRSGFIHAKVPTLFGQSMHQILKPLFVSFRFNKML